MEIFDTPLYDDDFIKLVVRFAWNLLFLMLVVRFALHPNRAEREFTFTAVLLNITVFFICFTLKKLDIGLGMALGLFAIFGVLRYRTDAIRTKEMTYLFLLIGIAVINSLSGKQTSHLELLAVNTTMLVAAMFAERVVWAALSREAKKPKVKQVKRQTVEYDRIELLAPERYDELLADLRARTGLPVVKVQVKTIDLRLGGASLVLNLDPSALPVDEDDSDLE
ncbi:hypothetical protein Pla123a_00580 [Posidoniimonas polymericola]|uniref:DUF4956 domain-containing protein n=1 Tax=Posidoniimonas polymericola TaxID=2528002 RepID=A0A5C5ZEI1_9BACT|nr:DUF4956 domain-containing protein [Posidoniimonas polymericola]TWT85251.1 hypothetical protein Pla123a_00580 [Posidoniimonas polymericola]